MDNKGVFLFSLFACLMVLAGCGDRHCKAIDTAYAIADDSPDSALSILNHLNQHCLATCEKARYALVYTIAQDKSGLDVDNDSLLRIAYTYYYSKPNDSLYAKCQYYMGKYYALNDSSEKALVCFQKSVTSAKGLHDENTLCLSLYQQSVILRNYDSQKALACARAVVDIYNNVKGYKLSNKSYSLLNLAECIAYGGGNTDECISLAKDAIKYALQSRDSTTISDLSRFSGLL